VSLNMVAPYWRLSLKPTISNVCGLFPKWRKACFKNGEMNLTLRRLLKNGAGEAKTPGSVYAFVPALAESKASPLARELSRTLSESLGFSTLLADFYARGFPVWGTTEAPQRLDSHTWSTFVTPGEAFDTLEGREAHPRAIRRLLDRARELYNVTCADLTEAKEVVALEVLRQADSIFIVSNSDAASLEMVQFKARWLRTIDLGHNSGLLLRRVPGGSSPAEVEERTGLPVCATIDSADQLRNFAAWLAATRNPKCMETAQQLTA